MKAADVMTPDVVTATPETSIAEAAKLMIDRRISGLPVIDERGKLVGIVSEGDLLRRAEAKTERKRPRWLEFLVPNSRLAAEYVKSHAKRVKDVMTTDVVTVTESTLLADIADLLESCRVKRVPVMREDRMVGIVTRSSLLRAVASGVIGHAAQPADHAIREAILAELKKQKWADPSESNIVVNQGVVHLWGVVLSDAERQALRVAAENVTGVRLVEDHLIAERFVAGM